MEKGKFGKQEEEKGDFSIEQMQELYRTLDIDDLTKISSIRHKIKVKSIEEFVKMMKYSSETEALEQIHELVESLRYSTGLTKLLWDKTDQEVLDFLHRMSEARPKVMEGIKIEGVYCDIEGTLFNRGELNNDTLQKLKNFEKEGKQITLWTDGDIKELQLLLDKEDIKYPLKRKIDYAGADAEIVIDNDDKEDFNTRTGIHPKTFIKV